MPNQYRNRETFRDISAIDAKLTELEQEKQQLLALKEALNNPVLKEEYMKNKRNIPA